MTYERKLLRIEIGIEIRSVEFTYDYTAEIMDLGPDGYIEGTVDDMIIKADFLIDMTDLYIFMQDFRIERVGWVIPANLPPPYTKLINFFVL